MNTAFAVVVILFFITLSCSFQQFANSQPLLSDEKRNVQKRSLYTEKNYGLPVMEKIAKRSVADARRNLDDDDIMETGASGVYFLPSFARRGKRSVENAEDLETGASGVYFLPSFARRGKRSTSEDVDDMDSAASGVYFLPSFARRG